MPGTIRDGRHEQEATSLEGANHAPIPAEHGHWVSTRLGVRQSMPVCCRLDTKKSTTYDLRLTLLAIEDGNLHRGCNAPVLSSKDVEISTSATPIVSAEEATRIA
ncbi:hypothetical protein XPA_001967 [Xanthoria parietina]